MNAAGTATITFSPNSCGSGCMRASRPFLNIYYAWALTLTGTLNQDELDVGVLLGPVLQAVQQFQGG